MRLISRKILLATLITMQATLFMSFGAVPADAALKAFSPTLTFVADPPAAIDPNGLPTWFQGQNGVAVAPCQVVGCGLLPAAPGTFTGAFPLVFPSNYPAESFYFLAQSPKAIPMAPGIDVDVFAALEYTTIDPVTLLPGVAPVAGVKMGTFQRLRISVAVPLGTTVPAGTWTVLHPWGTTTFDAVTDCKNKAGGCQMTRDVPVPAPNDFASTLGIVNNPAVPSPAFSMDTFLKSAIPGATPAFLGDALTAATFTGGTVRQFFQINGPPGAGTTGPITTAIITGKTVGMDVQPVNPNFGASLIATATAPKTVTVTNATSNSITFPALAVAGADLVDFAILPPTAPALNCSGNALVAGASCSFNITFTPTPVAKAARVATIALAPAVTAPVPVGATPPPPVTVNLSGTAHVLVTSTVTTPHGTITPDVAPDPATGGVPAGSPITFTVTPSNKKFKAKSVADGAALLGTPPGTAPFTIANTGAVNHTVTVDFMPSGDLDASGTLDVADALKALKIVAGVQQADVDDPNNSAVKVAPLDTAGKPAALDAKANPDVADVLVILRRVLNLDTW